MTAFEMEVVDFWDDSLVGFFGSVGGLVTGVLFDLEVEDGLVFCLALFYGGMLNGHALRFGSMSFLSSYLTPFFRMLILLLLLPIHYKSTILLDRNTRFRKIPRIHLTHPLPSLHLPARSLLTPYNQILSIQ